MNYTDISPEFTAKFFELINAANRVVITGHRSPDDDAYSSALAIYEIIKTKTPQKNVNLILEAQPEDRYKTFKNSNLIEFVQDLSGHVSADDLLIMVDGSQYHRFTLQPEKLASTKTTICIDHHSSPIDDFTLSLVAPEYPAATEIVYRTFCNEGAISKDLAAIFLLGILGDTGTFAYLRPDQTGTLEVAKKLIGITGVAIQEFKAVYNSISEKEFEVQKELLKNAAFGNVQGWPRFLYSLLSEDFVKNGEYTENELSGGIFTSHYLLKVKDTQWGFVVTPKLNGEVRISCRSLPGSVNVRDLMERMQLGGGHNRAAGGKFVNTKPEDAINAVIEWIGKNKPTLG